MSNWFTAQRQAFIDATISQFGQITRQDIVNQFGITVTQASADIQTYLAQTAHKVRYDTSAKVYTTDPLPKRAAGPDTDRDKWTVLMMKPDHWRSDESCAADEVVRLWVVSPDPESAELEALHKLTEDLDGVGYGDHETSPEDFATVAIYPGHLFDRHKGE